MNVLKKIVLIVLLVLIVIFEKNVITLLEDLTVKQGVIDKNNNIIIEDKYDYIFGIDYMNNKEHMRVEKSNFFGNSSESFYIDIDGNEYYKGAELYFTENRAVKLDTALKKFGYIDFDGNKITDFIYDTWDDYKNGYVVVGIKNAGKTLYGVLDINGNQVIPCEYNKIERDSFKENFFFAYKNNAEYVINTNGEVIAEYTENGKIRFVNLNDLTNLGEIDSENVKFFHDLILIVRNESDGKYEVYNMLGEKKTDTRYDDIAKTYDDNYRVKVSNNYYIVDNNFNVVKDITKLFEIDPKLSNIVNNRAVFKKGNQYGVIDFDGNIIIEPIYDNIDIRDEFIYVYKDDEVGTLDKDGNEVFKLSNQYKDIIHLDGDYYIIEKTNMKLFAAWISIIIVGIIIVIVLLIGIFKKSKKIEK